MERRWESLQQRFGRLHRFVGLRTVFPGTAVVESDFSAINREPSCFRRNLRDFSLEGVHSHSKEHHTLKS